MWAWVEDIGALYRRHAARLEVWDDTWPLDHHPAAFVERHGELKRPLSQMQTRWEGHLGAKDLPRAKAKVRTSLRTHWEGLTVLVERPEVARDNKAAERARHNPVVGRKNSYGSGRGWRAHLAAMLGSVRQTVVVWGLQPHHGLRTFFHACADHGGKSPRDLSPFLPGAMTPERRADRARPVPMMWPPSASGFPEQGASASVDTSSALIRLGVLSHCSPRAVPQCTHQGARRACACQTTQHRIKCCRSMCPHPSRRDDDVGYPANSLGWDNRIFTYKAPVMFQTEDDLLHREPPFVDDP